MMDEGTTPEDIVGLIRLISSDKDFKNLQFSALRWGIRECFIKHPQLIDSFVQIKGSEALVGLVHSSNGRIKKFGHDIIRFLCDICRDLDHYGIGLFKRLCALLKEEDVMIIYKCRLFLASKALKLLKHDKPTLLVIITDLYKGVNSDLLKHVEDKQFDSDCFRLYPLLLFTLHFDMISEELKNNEPIKEVCVSLMERLQSLVPNCFEFTHDAIQALCEITEVIHSAAVFNGEFYKFDEFVTSIIDDFREMITICLRFYGNSWLHDHGWVIKYMGLEWTEKLRYGHIILPPVNTDVRFRIIVNRSEILDQSEAYLMTANVEQLRGSLEVRFIGELGNGEGVVREWFVLFVEEMLNRKLFFSPSPDKRKVLPTREPLGDMFPFIAAGKLIALALMHKVHLGIKLDKIMYLSFAGRAVLIKDIKDSDPRLYKSWMEFNSRKPSISYRVEGDENLVQNSFDAFMESISKKVDAVRRGFDSVVGPTQRKIFFRELEEEDIDAFLLGDSHDICVHDWKCHTDTNSYGKTLPQLLWLWKVLTDLSPEDRRKMLFFWTSIKFLPPQGFRGLHKRLRIVLGSEKDKDREGRLPTSHTCLFQLYLPMYSSYRVLEARVQSILKEHFDFGML